MTQVETFLETQEILVDEKEIESYNQKVIDLGLKNLAIKIDKKPITPMSDLEIAVYECLCEKSISLHEYKHMIPERVIDALASVKSFLEDFASEKGDKLEFIVRIDEDPDPILIAKVGWRNKFLIGRWGTELQDFPSLLKRAKEKKLAKAVKAINEAKSYVELFEKDKESFSTALLMGNIESIYFR